MPLGGLRGRRLGASLFGYVGDDALDGAGSALVVEVEGLALVDPAGVARLVDHLEFAVGRGLAREGVLP